MIAKAAIFLFFAGACLAYPADEEQRPVAPDSPVPVPPQPIPPQPIQASPEGPSPITPEGQLPHGILNGPDGGKPENSDLKTDNTFWYRRRAYYPVYRRFYPRSYSYSYYPSRSYYSYWYPYTYYW